MKGIRILGGRILLKAIKSAQTDIIRPTEIEHYEVAAIGPEVKDLKVGDKVLFQMAPKVQILGNDYHLADIDDIICVIEWKQ